MNKTISYQSFIENELKLRQSRSSRYSLRAFARDLDVPAPKLSQIMRGLAGISGETAKKIAKKLKLSEADQQLFISLVESQHARSRADREKAQKKIESFSMTNQYDELALESFKIISDWYHMAILELTEVKGFKPETKWIAQRLKITTAEAEAAVERLFEFGLLKKMPNGKWMQTHTTMATPSGIPSFEIRKCHSQILLKAQNALDATPIDQRDFSALTFSFSSKQTAEAQKLIKEFRRKFGELVQTNEPKDNVYCMAIQMFPLDNKEI